MASLQFLQLLCFGNLGEDLQTYLSKRSFFLSSCFNCPCEEILLTKRTPHELELQLFPLNISCVTPKNANEAVDASTVDNKTPEKQQESSTEEKQQEPDSVSILSEKRKALFEPLEPVSNANGKRPSAESLLPPPDFESASYPKGWLIGKKRKLVNVDVVESMRRIAVQEMNRKDREIDGLNEQLEEDARCLEHLQLQLLEERSKRADVERQNAMLQNQIAMLMDVLQENEAVEEEGTEGN
ncbi:UNVERIFIED_CONTAM: protein HEADING DATE REPRESSOR 1 [Sesamum latifolium]|uniref:Protein HEADING DATE REPRESSOR 1 n=1 Tax=Sesamum latifolium TaxID=2727402 RepID=A0AAW2YDZ5_9LAMI